MEELGRFSRGRFLRLSAMTAGGLVQAGCNLEEGGSPPGAKRGGGGEGEVDFGKIQAGQSPELEKLAEDWKPYDGETAEISVWMYTPDERSLNAYKKAFEKAYSNIKLKYVIYPEESYITKLNVALQTHNPPDVAIMEEKAWMKAGLVADLSSFYKAWGLSVADFAPGGVGRFTLEDGPKQGIFGVEVSNQRSDFLHKLTTGLTRKYDCICVEDLSVKGLAKTRLSRSILDAAFGEFVRQVQYKAAWNLRHSVKVGRFFPSTKLCSECGVLNPNLNLSDKTWLCVSCGTQHDRDLNASKNILAEGPRFVAAGQSETLNARGEPVSLPTGSTAR